MEVRVTPNQITLFRVVLAFLAVVLFTAARSNVEPALWAGPAALSLVVAAIALDAVDGYVARRKRLATPLGAQLDVLGDRVVEQLFFTYFAVCGLISLWVPVVFFVRGALTDFVRGPAAGSKGNEAASSASGSFGVATAWGKALVASRASRAAYGAVKCLCFCCLGAQMAVSSAKQLGEWTALRESLAQASEILVVVTILFCLVRGLPVLWEGRRCLESPRAGGAQPSLNGMGAPVTSR
jgi:CDP-diacylglycerol--glycerol-3-phosphate 3-phosphatidyltransferase